MEMDLINGELMSMRRMVMMNDVSVAELLVSYAWLTLIHKVK